MAEPGAALPELVFVTRLDCGLCESFAAALAGWEAGRGRYRLTVLDVDADPGLTARWGLKVPVLLAGDREICTFRFKAERLAAVLDAA